MENGKFHWKLEIEHRQSTIGLSKHIVMWITSNL